MYLPGVSNWKIIEQLFLVLLDGKNSGDKIAGVFAMQTLSMIWDFCRIKSFLYCDAKTGWLKSNGLRELWDNLPCNVNVGKVHQADAATTIHTYNGPVIVTDPPYYDNIGYADLSDFLLCMATTPAP